MLEVRSGHLLVHTVPYVNSKREVREDGILVMRLSGESSTTPGDHTAHFIGECPCTAEGTELVQIKNSSRQQQLAPDLVVDHYFSAKPRTENRNYANFYDKVVLYTDAISGPAGVLRPGISARTFRPVAATPEESVFLYLDTATPRAGLTVATQRFHPLRIAIVGLGGNGAYVLDLVAKTPVAEIHLFDGDTFFQHNAFRSPGSSTLEELEGAPKKVDHLCSMYARMRRGIIPHPEMITPDNVHLLRDFDYVFLCVDRGSVRHLVVDALQATKTQLIDTGMGVEINEETQKVYGICRVSMLTESRHDHAARCIPMADAEDHGIYRNNVQIAELNALNAALAVIRWKKAVGFYSDNSTDHDMAYTIETNLIANSEGSP